MASNPALYQVATVYDKAGGIVTVQRGDGSLLVHVVPGSPCPLPGDLIFVSPMEGGGFAGVAPYTPRPRDEGILVPGLHRYWNFVGAGVAVTEDPVTDSYLVTVTGSGMIIQDEEVDLPVEPRLDFSGLGVTAADDLSNPLQPRTKVVIPGAHRILGADVPFAQQPDLNFVGFTVENDIPNNATKITNAGGVSTINLLDGDGATAIAAAPSAHSLIVGFDATIVSATIKLNAAASGAFVIERRPAGSGAAWAAISPTLTMTADDYQRITDVSAWTTAITALDDIRVNVTDAGSLTAYTIGLDIARA